MVIESVPFEDFKPFIWLGPVAMVTVHDVTMFTMVVLYNYHLDEEIPSSSSTNLLNF